MSEIQARINQIHDMMVAGIFKPDYEAMLEMYYRRWIQPGDTVVDVGAHVGRHLACMLEAVGDCVPESAAGAGVVYGFEPLPFAFDKLQQKFAYRRMLSSGAANQVRLENVALAARSGMSEFVYARGTPQESGLRQRIFNNPDDANPTKITVEVKTLDDYINGLANLSFIKIDTEGGEIGCLQGAVKTLARYRPLVSVEYGLQGYAAYGHTKATLYEHAEALDYVLYDIFLNRLADSRDWETACDSVYWDYFMVPREKETEFMTRVGLRTT